MGKQNKLRMMVLLKNFSIKFMIVYSVYALKYVMGIESNLSLDIKTLE